ncbi:uncharacterized protein TRAVEDRAFT_170736 [Trametes versicolor FP-101664 SS1]|uniref:uncharacterized protein n=1 Tax=Trametes versicolor (strain FP-101664) TaxID=717944 RepID=UPI000462377C|nr:uncharacterized protein TRAVEDRAFT_170736 [Trametes versicolor FP-101664 SS1]EIW56755.1 hypothetical protein TRAVEDRAFT_170736 [Trametes versicolor FP-101664 SS1]
MAAPYTGPLHVLQDSGVPGDCTNYTTVVIVHGYAWHGGIFSKLVPLAESHSVRIILLNRRDYTGSLPYTEAERALLTVLSPEIMSNAAEAATAKKNAATFMQDRARELYDFLVQLVKNSNLPLLDRGTNKGGIVLAGWSFGTLWMTALLAYVALFPVDDVRLSDYMRSVTFLDPPYLAFGYPPPDNQYNPLFDADIPLNDREKAFTNWVSGYYVHGDTPETLELKTPLQSPPPTLSTLTPEEIGRTLCLPPGGPGGSDSMLLDLGLKLGLFSSLREGGLYMPKEGQSGDAWDSVEVRYISCERSVWEMPWGTSLLRKEMEAAQEQSLPMRTIRFVFVKGANHFVHWDQPELALRALIGDRDVVS